MVCRRDLGGGGKTHPLDRSVGATLRREGGCVGEFGRCVLVRAQVPTQRHPQRGRAREQRRGPTRETRATPALFPIRHGTWTRRMRAVMRTRTRAHAGHTLKSRWGGGVLIALLAAHHEHAPPPSLSHRLRRTAARAPGHGWCGEMRVLEARKPGACDI